MIYTKKNIDVFANETGFIRYNIEKVIRLLDVLNFIYTKSSFKDSLILKGGTAINLIYTNLKRLSVDIDLDYHGSLDRETAFRDRDIISRELDEFMESEDYDISNKSRESHALFSKVYSYNNASGNIDYIKIEINFMDRVSLYPITTSTFTYFGKTVTVKAPVFEELFAMKLAALLDRSKPRDLYDSMQLFKNIEISDKNRLRKAATFYLSLDGIYKIDEVSFDKIRAISKQDVKTQLQPVLKKAEIFDLDSAKNNVIEILKDILSLSEEEKLYLEEFSKGNFKADLLFDDQITEIANKHPMVMWRLLNIKQ